MLGAVRKAMAPKEQTLVAGIPDGAVQRRLARDTRLGAVTFAPDLARLRDLVHRNHPRVILLDDRFVAPDSLTEVLSEIVSVAPVVLVAPYSAYVEISDRIAEGLVEFVPREGEWIQLAASLIERRLRWAEGAWKEPEALPFAVGSLGDIFRHEINNPLTGILGNAELILAHSDRLPAIDVQRIRTVVELAVRLRETVRRLSNAFENRPGPPRSA